jgi:hypothetical protein
MSEKEVDIEILRAMDKLDKDLEVMNQKKLILHRKKKVIKVLPELSLNEKTQEKTKEFNKALFDEVKFKTALGVGLFVITLVVVSSLSMAKQFSFMEHFIVVLCCVGIVASKR